ncbi:MAG: thioredoxin family protein [Cyclobacteriaceae bacterium]|jgi:thioredoxin-like negative regulator of GroEL
MNKGQLISNQSVAIYFTSPECNVCKVLKPKVRELIDQKFPKMDLHFIDISENPMTAAEFQVFTVPVILIYFEGQEYIRKVRNIGLFELEKEISRPYELLFES